MPHKWNFSRLQSILRKTQQPDFRLFLYMLLFSTTIWFVLRLSQPYTVVIDVALDCKDVPDGFSINTQKINPLRIRVQADGSTLLLNMGSLHSLSIPIDVARLRYHKQGADTWVTYTPNHFDQSIHEYLPHQVSFIDMLTDSVRIPLLQVKSKRLPIRVCDAITLEGQHIYSQPTRVQPATIMVQGTNDIIDTMQAVYTNRLAPMTLTDTTEVRATLALPDGVTANATEALVNYFVETYTEKQLDVPISAINVPEGYSFKAFPSTAQVKYNIGMSKFETYDVSDFDIVADLSDVSLGSNEPKIKLHLRSVPPEAQNITYSPLFVEYLLERRK